MSEPRVCSECGAKLEGLTCRNCGAIQLIGVDAYKELLDILEILIKEDREYAASILRTGFSAVTPDPQNLLSEAPTSEGKTYPIVIIMSLFPSKHIWLLGGLSPTALSHDHGVLVDVDTREELAPRLDELYLELDMLGRGKKDKKQRRAIQNQIREILKNACSRVDLDGIIIVFLDNPHQETMNRLRPILSHDTWEILYKVTDRRSKGARLEQMKTKLVGWPSAIAAITKGHSDKDVWDQMISRFITVSPKQNKTKYREATKLSALKHGLPQPMIDRLLHEERFEWARKAIEKIWNRLSELRDEARDLTRSKSPNMYWIPFYEHIGDNFPANIGRHMRDSKRFMTALYMGAAINVFARPTLQIGDFKSIIVVRQDYERAYDEFFTEERKGTIFTGLSSNVINFFNNVVVPLWHTSYVLVGEPPQTKLPDTEDKAENAVQGIEMSQLVRGVIKNLGKSLSSDTIRKHYTGPLENAGLMDKIGHPNDKRKNLHIVLRTDITEIKEGEKGLSKEVDIFTLENLKEAYNKIKQIAASEQEIYIRAPTGEVLSIEELYETCYAYKDPRFDAAISLSENKQRNTKTEEKTEAEAKSSKTPINGDETPRKNEERKRPEDEREQSLVDKLVKTVRDHGEVGELWPRVYLEDRGIPREQAENIVRGLANVGKISQTPSKTWRAPK